MFSYGGVIWDCLEIGFRTLESIGKIASPNVAEEAGLIQVFEYTFELGWKVLKDVLVDQGYSPKFPRETIKLAFQTGLILNGRLWLEALDNRNLMANTYSDENAQKALLLIRQEYIPMLTELLSTLQKQV